eukprot:scaffold2868_cov171-Amphora_coffeaeformis.AAC.17
MTHVDILLAVVVSIARTVPFSSPQDLSGVRDPKCTSSWPQNQKVTPNRLGRHIRMQESTWRPVYVSLAHGLQWIGTFYNGLRLMSSHDPPEYGRIRTEAL